MALAGGAMGLINALGNLGGFTGPYIGGWLQDASGGSFVSTAVVLAVALVLGGVGDDYATSASRPASRGTSAGAGQTQAHQPRRAT